jgi:hypothetical protein
MIRQKRKIAIKYVLRTLQNFRKETNKKRRRRRREVYFIVVE